MSVQDIIDFFSDGDQLTTWLVVAGVLVTLVALAMTMFRDDTLARRMKSVGVERERIRARERARMKATAVAQTGAASLRHQQFKPFMKEIVERFSLSKWLSTQDAKSRLALAGFRGPAAETTFLFFRLVSPIALTSAAAFYLVVIDDFGLSLPILAAIVLGAAYLGVKVPELFLANTITKRQAKMKRAFPDALDLLLICVESGMSIEHAFRKVSQEIGIQSGELAEEFALTTAELSFLEDRRVAYQPSRENRARERQAARDRSGAGGKIRHAARTRLADLGAGIPRSAHDRGGKDGGGAAAEAHRADDRVLPSRSARRGDRAGHHSADGCGSLTRAARDFAV
jgi:tight adherence protein C